MAGWAFPAALRAAQQGRTEGFLALFRDHQPALIRTLRGLAPELADRAAAATWRQVVRDLASYSGDEYGFRVWLITLGRIHLRALQQRTPDHQHAEAPVRTRRELRTLRFVTPRPARSAKGTAADRPSGTGAAGNPAGPARPPGRGAATRWAWPLTTDEALLRVRELPADQAEAVLLRVVADLDVLTVADRLHHGSSDTRALYQRGLRTASRPRRGSPVAPAGLAGPVLLGPAATRIELLLDDPACQPTGASEQRMAELLALLRAPATEADLRGEAEAVAAFTGAGGGRGLARARRRTVAIAVVSAATTVMTITTAAAATGTLPTGLQQWAHTYVGAPAPAHALLAPLDQGIDAASDDGTAAADDAPVQPSTAAQRGSTHTTRDRSPAVEPQATVAVHEPDAETTTSPAEDPAPSTTPEPSAAPSVTGSPDDTTAPTDDPSATPSDTPSSSPSASGSDAPSVTTSPPSSPSGTPSGTPSASAAPPADTSSGITSGAPPDATGSDASTSGSTDASTS